MQQINNYTPPYVRSTGETITFWLLWVLFLPPLIFATFLVFDTNGLGLLAAAIVAQIAIHIYSAGLFFTKQQPFSNALIWLLIGTGVIYMLFVGGCFVAISGGLNLH